MQIERPVRRTLAALHNVNAPITHVLVAALLLVSASSCGEGSARLDDPSTPLGTPSAPLTTDEATLCPASAEADLALCLSFAHVDAASGGQTDIGGLSVHIEGSPKRVDGRRGRALFFDGEQDRVVLEGFSLAQQPLTVAAWVKPDGKQTKWASLVDFWARDQGFWLGGSDVPGGWAFWVNGDRVRHGRGLVEGKWQHVAAVLEAPEVGFAGGAGDDGQLPTARVSLYINGRLMDRVSDAWLYQAPALTALYLGGRGDRSDFFRGTIDELQVWTSARAPEQLCGDAGGSYQSESGCSFVLPTAEVASPCADVACGGHGSCTIDRDGLACACDAGYQADGLVCRAPQDVCTGIPAAAKTWAEWYEGQLSTDALALAQQQVSQHVAANSAFSPQAEAWTAFGLAGLLQGSQQGACLGFLRAAQVDSKNPVALNNAATCMMTLGYHEDARSFLACSLALAPQNATAKAGQAFLDYTVDGDVSAALKKYEEAATLDPKNPEWRYQAMQLALEQNDKVRARGHLSQLPAANALSSTGYRGVLPSDDPQKPDAGYCCPCGGAKVYEALDDCVQACGATLSCFTNICTYTGKCTGQGLPFNLQLKLCIPPIGLQVCFSVDTDGKLGLTVGASLFNGMFGVGVGLQANVMSGRVNVVVDAGLGKLPINPGASLTYDLKSGKVEGVAGLGNKSGTTSGQVTLLSK